MGQFLQDCGAQWSELPLAGWHRPCAKAARVATAMPQTATIAGLNARTRTIAFTVENADLSTGAMAALSGLELPGADLSGGWDTVFVWGLPFF